MWLYQCESLFLLKLGRKKRAAELSGEGLGELMAFCVCGRKLISNPAEVLRVLKGSHVWSPKLCGDGDMEETMRLSCL